jgi:hypothetical protein
MTMAEIVHQISFLLGIPANENVEDLHIEDAVLIAFRELKRYIKNPEDKTVPYSRRIDLLEQGIITNKVLYVYPSRPKVGLALSNVDSTNVFQVAAAVNFGGLQNASTSDLDPIILQLSMAQAANTLSQDFQWTYSVDNQCVYCTCKQVQPGTVTIRYVPDYQDVSEIKSQTWLDYLIRLGEAYMKKSLGRSRSKYTIEGSNVSTDGEILLSEANAELETIRAELESRKNKLIVVN